MRRQTWSWLSILGFAGSAALVLNRLRKDQPAQNHQPLRPAGASAVPNSTGRGLTPAAKGGDAASPVEIPWPGWREIAIRTAKKFSENELMSEAASVTFFALLALFPAITAIVSIYGLFADPSTIQGHLDSVSSLMPSGGVDIIREQVKRLTQNPASRLGLGAIVGLLAALWSANQGSKAMFSALNVVYDETETRGFFKVLGVSLAFTIGGILFLLLGIGVIVVLPLLFDVLGLSGFLDVAIRILRWPVILFVLVAMLSVLYRYGPSRQPPVRWRWVTWGGAFAAAAWIALSLGFSWYVTNFGSYNKTYGSLGAIIGFMTWIWLSSTVLLLGGQLNAELESQTDHDPTGAREPSQDRLRGRAAKALPASA